MPKTLASSAGTPRWRNHPSLPGLALGLGAFLTQFDVTAVVIALPAINSELGLDVAGYAWVMDAYSLAFTGMLLVAGALADRHGRRRALLAGNALFAVASLACGLAWDGPSLWAARAFQGMGAAFVVTGAIALLAGAYPEPTARARAFALVGVVSGAAMALGPTLGGLIAGGLGWRVIFLANLPVCALVAWAVPRLVPEVREAEARPLDLAGVMLVTLALGIAIEALLQGRRAPGHAAAAMIVSAGLVAIFILQQRRRPRPMLDPSIFATPAMIGVGVLLLAVSIGYWAVLVYLPLFLQAVFQWSTQVSGWALLAATAPMLALPPLGGRLATRWGWRRLFAFGLVTMVVGNLMLALSLAGPVNAARLAAVLLGMAVIGTGAALVHPQLSGAAVALVPAGQAGMASAMTVVARQAGFALGIAALGAVLPSEAAAEAFAWSFGLAAVASIVGFVAAVMLLPRCRPWARAG